MATSRIGIRINEDLKASAEKAAAFKNISLTEYVVHLIEKDVEQVIKEHENITLADDVFDRFMTACEQADRPNQKLRDALNYSDR